MYYRSLGATYQAKPSELSREELYASRGTRVERDLAAAGVPSALIPAALDLWKLWNEKARKEGDVFGTLKYKAWRAKPYDERIARIAKEVMKKAPSGPVLPPGMPPAGPFGISTTTWLLIGGVGAALILFTGKKGDKA